jgi:ABC-type transport system involved in multi-copper enzyme maturation permease subunit
MSSLRSIYQLARADFLERTRRYSFLITLGLILFLAYSYVPSRDAGYITLAVDGARGVYNSAWVGSLVAILTGIMLPLLGFYLVKNAVARDSQTGVGQIMATTPLTRPVYTLGKWLSNFAVLALMAGVTALAAVVLQLARGEDRQLDLLALFMPMLWLMLPTLALVAALAVLFETVGWLRGGLGNVIYFFVCTAVTMASFLPVMMSAGSLEAVSLPVDVFGIGLPLGSMLQATSVAFPGLDAGNNSIGPVPLALASPLQTFVWAGVAWTPAVIGARLLWLGVAGGIALLAALCFNRFDPSRIKVRKRDAGTAPVPVELPDTPVAPVQLVTLSALVPSQFSFGRLLLAELRLVRASLRWWWFLIAAGLIAGGLLAPSNVAQQYLLPAAWLWPLLAWSALGAREVRYQTAQLVFSAAHPLGRQLPATWMAGVVVTALSGSGVALNLLLAGDMTSLFAWTVAALFIPSLALTLAVWSGSGKLFEVVYMLLWWFGPLNQLVPQLDFMGVSDSARAGGMPLVYLTTTLALLGSAIIGRWRQIQE